jgi:hypothetical protein
MVLQQNIYIREILIFIINQNQLRKKSVFIFGGSIILTFSKHREPRRVYNHIMSHVNNDYNIFQGKLMKISMWPKLIRVFRWERKQIFHFYILMMTQLAGF